MKKNGTTSAGKTRYRCTHCGASHTPKRPGSTQAHQLEQFITWVTGTRSQDETGYPSARTFRNRTGWCWDVFAHITPSTHRAHEIQLDGIYFHTGTGKHRHNAVVLIAYSKGKILDYHISSSENTRAWCALLDKIPAPQVVIIDGGTGLYSALKTCWPGTKVQRCLVHVQRVVRRYITLNPRTQAGRELLAMINKLTKVSSIEQATRWLVAFQTWYGKYRKFLDERSVDPVSGRLRRTHERLWKAYRSVQTVISRGELFTFLDEDLTRGGVVEVSATTNRIEGGVNAQLRAVVRAHRGMPLRRRLLVVGWWVWVHAVCPVPVGELLERYRYRDTSAREVVTSQTGGTDSVVGVPVEVFWGEGLSVRTH